MASAEFYVSVNSGANQQGGIDVESADTIDLVPVSTVGWLRVRWEIYDYPEGWTAPTGWSTAADGTIYNEDFTPDQFAMPDNGVRWGVWMLRCLVNEQIDTDQEVIGDLLYDGNALSLLSPSGLRDCGAREEDQFTTTTTRIKKWLRSYQRNLRALENPRSSFTSTLSATPVVARRWTTTADGSYSFRALVNVSDGAGEYAEYEVKAAYDKAAGVLSQMYAPSITTNAETATLAGTAPHIAVTPDGNDAVELVITPDATLTLTWKISEFALY